MSTECTLVRMMDVRLMLTARRFQMKINRREEEIMMELRVSAV